MAKRVGRLTDEQIAMLEPYMRAGMAGAHLSRWRIGAPLEYLVAPIVLQIIIQVSKELRLGELVADG